MCVCAGMCVQVHVNLECDEIINKECYVFYVYYMWLLNLKTTANGWHYVINAWRSSAQNITLY